MRSARRVSLKSIFRQPIEIQEPRPGHRWQTDPDGRSRYHGWRPGIGVQPSRRQSEAPIPNYFRSYLLGRQQELSQIAIIDIYGG